MKIIRGGRAGGPAQRRTETFTGDVLADAVMAQTDGVLMNSVTFAPGARTHWHTHHGGQILIVTSGEGRVCDRDGAGGTITAGDIVFIPPGVEHWHGAGPENPMVHLAISLQGHDWLDPVTPAEYDSAQD